MRTIFLQKKPITLHHRLEDLNANLQHFSNDLDICTSIYEASEDKIRETKAQTWIATVYSKATVKERYAQVEITTTTTTINNGTNENDCLQNSFVKELVNEKFDTETPQQNLNLMRRFCMSWSSDGKILAIANESTLWIFTWPSLLPSDVDATKPLCISLPLNQYGDYESSRISGLFFAGKEKGRILFLLLEQGILLKMDISTSQLYLFLSQENTTQEELAKAQQRYFQCEQVVQMENWHAAGITASAYDPMSKLLVVAGGLKNPSEVLRKSKASSLSVWKIQTEQEPHCELLDYTMVLKNGLNQREDNDKASDADEEIDANEIIIKEANGGLFTSAKRVLLSPLNFLFGIGTSEPIFYTKGSIQKLAISPYGSYAAIIDRMGRLCIRQIDACANVLPWQLVNLSKLRDILWLSNTELVVTCVEDQKVLLVELKAAEMNVDGTSASIKLEVVPYKQIQAEPTGQELQLVHVVGSKKQKEEPRCGAQPSFRYFTVEKISNRLQTSITSDIEVEKYVEALVEAKKYDQALVFVEQLKKMGISVPLDMDALHQKVWLKFCSQYSHEAADRALIVDSYDQKASEEALYHLIQVQNKEWTLEQCVNVILGSFMEMKTLYGIALRALITLESSAQQDHRRIQDIKKCLHKSMYRLETLRLILLDEQKEDTENTTGEITVVYDPQVFERFRQANLVEIAEHLAQQGRITALGVLFQRHRLNLVPFQLQILSKIPATMSPFEYVQLLPALRLDMPTSSINNTHSGLYKLQRAIQRGTEDGDDGEEDTKTSGSEDSICKVVMVEFPHENASHDLNPNEKNTMEMELYHKHLEFQMEEKAYWYIKRIKGMDKWFGQLESAYALSQLAMKALVFVPGTISSGSTIQAIEALHTLCGQLETLYKSTYLVQQPASEQTLMTDIVVIQPDPIPLDKWCGLSFENQVKTFLLFLLQLQGGQEYEGQAEVSSFNASRIIEEITRVFLKTEQQQYQRIGALDKLFATLCMDFVSKENDWTSLSLTAEMIHKSNPSLPLQERLIQNDTVLLRTAIECMYLVKPSSREMHTKIVDHLWTIFQSLPARKEDDPPEIAQLQVQVDEMEDLMAAVDILTKYDIQFVPFVLKQKLSQFPSLPLGKQLLIQMCTFAFGTSEHEQKMTWMDVWKDVMELVRCILGPQLAPEQVMEILVSQLLLHRQYDAAKQILMASSASASSNINSAFELIIRAIQENVNASSSGFSKNCPHVHVAMECIDMAQEMLSQETNTSLSEDDQRALQKQINTELHLLLVCQLLEVLEGNDDMRQHEVDEEDNSSVAYLPLKIRLMSEKDRQKLILGVLSKNPSHYRASIALKWVQESLPHVKIKDNGQLEPLQVMCLLANLMGISVEKDLIFKCQLELKGAYAALFCLDYETANELVIEVMQASHLFDSDDTGGKQTMDILNTLLSLLLDLVSSSSFRSWTQKKTICTHFFTFVMPHHPKVLSSNPAMVNLLFHHMNQLDALCALAQALDLQTEDMATTTTKEFMLLQVEEMIALYEEKAPKDKRPLIGILGNALRLLQVDSWQYKPPGEEEIGATVGQQSNEDKEKSHQMIKKMAFYSSQQVFDHWIQKTKTNQIPLTEGLEDAEEVDFTLVFGYLENLSLKEQEEICDQILAFTESLGLEENDPVRRQWKEKTARAFQTFFLSQAATATAGAMHNRDTEESEMMEDSSQTTHYEHQQQKLLTLARRLEQEMTSSQAKHELERAFACLDESSPGLQVDLNQFLRGDESYRKYILAKMAYQGHLDVAVELYEKYCAAPVDQATSTKETEDFGYECLMQYIQGVFFSFDTSISQENRHLQLEKAFRHGQGPSEDLMEKALVKPHLFGDCLVTKIYDRLQGQDHIGILLFLRMLLECSKRCRANSLSSPVVGLPFNKAVTDRLTLLFVCFKRFKEVDSQIHLKSLCSIPTHEELLSTSEAFDDSNIQNKAIQEIIPFLTSSSIKILAKLFNKLFKISSSELLMVFLEEMIQKALASTDSSDLTAEMQADLAAYAYESCLPFLSVLSSTHLGWFAWFLTGEEPETMPLWLEPLPSFQSSGEVLFGMAMQSMTWVGAHLEITKRSEVLCDLLSVVQSKNSGSASQLDTFLRFELMKATFQSICQNKWTQPEELAIYQALIQPLLDHSSSATPQVVDDSIVQVTAYFVESFESNQFLLKLMLKLVERGEEQGQDMLKLISWYTRIVSTLIDEEIQLFLQQNSPDQPNGAAATKTWRNCVTESTSLSRLGSYLGMLWPLTGDSSTNVKWWKQALELEKYVPLAESFSSEDLSKFQAQVLETLHKRIKSFEETEESSDPTADSSGTTTNASSNQLSLAAHLVRIVLNALTTAQADEQTIQQWTKWLEQLETKAVYGAFFGEDAMLLDAVLIQALENEWIDQVVDKMVSQKSKNERQKTLAIAHLVVQYMQKHGSTSEESNGLSAWHHQALQTQRQLVERTCGSSSVQGHPELREEHFHSQFNQEEVKKLMTCWMKLFTEAKWSSPNELIQYFKEHAYGVFIQCPPEEISQLYTFFLTTSSTSKQMVGLEIALMIPSALICREDVQLVLEKARALLVEEDTPLTEQKRRVFGLLVVRFDMTTVLQDLIQDDPENIKQRRLELLVADCFEDEKTWKQQRKGMFICGLVWAKEIAWAGRLACFEGQVHPMIWQYSYARLILGNYLKSLIEVCTIQIENLTIKKKVDLSNPKAKAAYDMLAYTKILYEKTYEKFMKYQRGQYDE